MNFKRNTIFLLAFFIFLFSFAYSTRASNDLVGWWKLDEGAGSIATDSSGNGKNGTLTNVTYSATVPDVDFENPYSAYFNSASSGRIISTPLSLNNFTEFTMAGWAYPTAANERASWFGQNDIFEFGFTDGDTTFCYTAKGEVSWDFNPATFLNNWHHITCLATSSQLIMYVDGTNVASTSISSGSFGSSGDNFSIGAGAVDGGTSGPFTGYIDDVRVYSRGLTPQEMESLGSGEEGPTNTISLSSLSPLDNATGVTVNANLIATFSDDAIVGTGNVGIYKSSNDSLFESIDITSNKVTFDGTTVTINPSGTFSELTEYYVLIPNTAIKNSDDEFFTGITTDTAWSFTTGDFTLPTITNITSSKDNGSYKAGEVINVTVTFSEAVTSTGNVTLTFETGDTDRTCTFTVTNSTTGNCNYTVQSGDTSSDLNATVSGTIKDAALNTMVSFTPSVSLATNKNLVIDTTAPVLTETGTITSPVSSTSATYSFSATESGTYSIGSCGHNATASISPGSSVTISNLESGKSYSCSFSLTDTAGNISNSLTISSFNVSMGGAVSVAFLQAISNNKNVTANANIVDNANNTEVLGSNVPYQGFTFKIDMRRGSSIPDVKTLQNFLKSLDGNIFPRNVESTGYFGPVTYASVVKFQELYTKEVLTPIGTTRGTGIVGPYTRAKLNNLLSNIN